MRAVSNARLALDERGDLLIQVIASLFLGSLITVIGIGYLTHFSNRPKQDAIAVQNLVTNASSLAVKTANGVTLTAAPSANGTLFTLYQGRGGTLGGVITNIQTAEPFLATISALPNNVNAYTLTWNTSGLMSVAQSTLPAPLSCTTPDYVSVTLSESGTSIAPQAVPCGN